MPLAELRAVTAELPQAEMQISVEQGLFMELLVRSLGARRCLDDSVGGDTFLCRRPGSSAAWREADDAEAPVRFERLGDVAEQRPNGLGMSGIVHLMVRIDDERCVEAVGQARVECGTEHGMDVLQVLSLNTSRDGFDHLRLDVLGEDQAVRPHAAGQMAGEIPTSRTEVRDDCAVGDANDIHDEVGLLPRVTIRCVEQTEIERRKEAAVLPGPEGARGLRRTEPAVLAERAPTERTGRDQAHHHDRGEVSHRKASET